MSNTDDRNDEMSDLLRAWGVSQTVIDTFKENGMQIRHLNKLTEFTIDKLIPRAGDRLDFMEHLQQYKDRLQSQNDLSALLQATTSGQMVLGHFTTYGSLNNNVRKVLANDIINNELSSNIHARMPSERIDFLAKEIVKLFPSETEVMWKGAYGGKSRRETSVGRGLLLQTYYSIRRKLRKCGVLAKESSACASRESVSDVEPDDDTDADNIQWLKNNSKPWKKVLELWEKTNNMRLRFLKKDAIAVHDYMDSYPALKHANGYLLLEQDFNQMYSNATMKLYAEFSVLEAFIIKNLTSEKEKLSIENSFSPGKKIISFLYIYIYINFFH
ncbi:hypothetical protein PUN28_006124 [Cardiocondyla obscurior]|uniref:SAM domain-containing protein n=1 Tax=Cardiocondyla obscurior TaxID=286306 RepID=A0AAW2GA68_9HYME